MAQLSSVPARNMRPAAQQALPSAGSAGAPSQPKSELTHSCVRCGAPVPLEIAMCERCNPSGLAQPAASQAHGTVFLGILVAVVILAVLAHLAVRGVGPFSGQVVGVAADAPGLAVTITVHNEGTQAGATTCRIDYAGSEGIGPESAYLLSPDVPPGGSVTYSGVVTTLGPTVRALMADCH